MIRANADSWNQCYVVTLGHVRVHVRGSDPDEALAQARRQLCAEMPRLWDVIQAMDSSRFQVRPLFPAADMSGQ